MKKANAFLWIIIAVFGLLWSCNLTVDLNDELVDDSSTAVIEKAHQPEGLAAASFSCDTDGVMSKGISTSYPSQYVSVQEPSSGEYVVTINTRPSGYTHYRSVMFSIYNNGSPSGWSINIGDSSTNNGWAGDAGTQSRDAEIQVYNNALSVYENQHGGSGSIHSQSGHLPNYDSKNVRYKIEDRKFSYWKNFNTSSTTRVVSKDLFALDNQNDTEGPENYTIYAGFNRTVGSSYRSGSGITTVYVYLQDPIDYNYSLIDPGSDYSLTLKHLKWRDGFWSWSDWKANTNFPGYSYFLNGHSSSDWNEKESEHIFIAEVWAPPASHVENIIFLSAGQQGALIDRQDYAAVVTGQKKDWHSASGLNGWKYVKEKSVNISWKSVAGQIIADAENNGAGYFGFNPENTYMALVFDACFYYEMSASKKNTRLEDYLQWMMSKCSNNYYGKLRKIYLAGASRGGALVSRMAYELRHDSYWSSKANDAEIIVSSFDGVANEKEGELNTVDYIRYLNPDGDGKAYKSSFTSTLTHKHDLHLLQIAGGRKVFFASSARAFYLFKETGVVDFRWVSRDHSDIGRGWHSDTSVAQLKWLGKWINNQ